MCQGLFWRRAVFRLVCHQRTNKTRRLRGLPGWGCGVWAHTSTGKHRHAHDTSGAGVGFFFLSCLGRESGWSFIGRHTYRQHTFMAPHGRYASDGHGLSRPHVPAFTPTQLFRYFYFRNILSYALLSRTPTFTHAPRPVCLSTHQGQQRDSIACEKNANIYTASHRDN